jgi:hypothetical protein
MPPRPLFEDIDGFCNLDRSNLHSVTISVEILILSFWYGRANHSLKSFTCLLHTYVPSTLLLSSTCSSPRSIVVWQLSSFESGWNIRLDISSCCGQEVWLVTTGLWACEHESQSAPAMKARLHGSSPNLPLYNNTPPPQHLRQLQQDPIPQALPHSTQVRHDDPN